MTRRLLLVTVAMLLIGSPPAAAKGVIKATVCGADGCRAVAVRSHDPALVEMGAEADGPRASGPGFVRLHITIGEGKDAAHGVRLTQLYVPARDLLAVHEDSGGWVWTTPLPAGSRALQRAARGVRPIPARRLPRAALPAHPRPPTVRPAAVDTAGAGGGRPGWLLAGGALFVVTAGFMARRHRRA
jgi:hypothetical protein